MGRPGEALADCEKATALDPLNEEVWINTGVVYRSLGRSADAASAYQRALKLKPKNGSAHYNYGVLLLDSGRRDPEVRGHFILACDAGVADACDILKRAGR
jgi:Tfp pilus assembly protein PilF